MTTKKITITLPEELIEQAKKFADGAGKPLSTWISGELEHAVRIADGLAAMREWEAEDGPIPEEELAEARAELSRADAAARVARAEARRHAA